MLRLAILGLICYREMSGYDIIKRFDDSLKGLVYAQKSHVYKELNTLYDAGMIGLRRQEQSSRPSKNVYFATEKGRQALHDHLIDMEEGAQFKQRLPFLLKVYFSANMPEEELLRSFKRFRALAVAAKEESRHAQEHISCEHRDDEHFPYWDMCADYCTTMYDAYITWADRCIARLSERTAGSNHM